MKVAIVGLDYVGLPLVVQFARANVFRKPACLLMPNPLVTKP
jgi:hypothetical protein